MVRRAVLYRGECRHDTGCVQSSCEGVSMMVPNVTPYAELQGLFALVAISSAAFTAWALLSWWVFDCRAVRISSAMLVSSCWVAIAAAGYYNLQQYGAFEQAITSTRSREVDHDIYRLASTTRTDLGSGISITTERYTDHTSRSSITLPGVTERLGGILDSAPPRYQADAAAAGGLVPLRSRRGFVW